MVIKELAETSRQGWHHEIHVVLIPTTINNKKQSIMIHLY